MRKPKSAILVSVFFPFALPVILLISFFQNPQIPSDWFAFVLKDTLDPGSAVNMGRLILDAPAGKHGFLKAGDGNFYFADGAQARFWGTNLCFSACFPDKKQAEMIAERLAFFGFNAVRLHHMDYYFQPRGIFADACPFCKNFQKKKTGTLNEKQLDRLDYLIYQLKLKGIYIDMNLLVSRKFTLADGIKDADKLRAAAKPASLFDPQLIALQKRYARDLLTHYNPYTKLRYCDDPAIALVEITNENSIFQIEKMTLPDYYLKQIDNLWKKFTKEKYPTLTEAKKALLVSMEKNYINQMINFLKKECGVKVPITGIGGHNSKDMLADIESSDFIDTHTYWDHPRFPNKSWDEKDFRIHNKSMLLDKNLGMIGEIIELAPQNNKPYTISEWNHCYPNTYAYETPVLMAYQAVKNGWDGLFQFAFSHDLKFYSRPGDIHYYFDAVSNPQQLILVSLASLVFYNNKAAYKTTLADGIFTLESPFIAGAAGFIKERTILFDSINLTSNQDGTVFIYSAENRPLEQSHKLILITLSNVKNENSGWKNKRFHWGKAPTLLRKMDVVVSLDLKKKFKVYALDASGRRRKLIKTRLENNRLIFSTRNSDSCWFEITTP